MNVREEDEKDAESKDEVDFVPVQRKDMNHNNVFKKPMYGDCVTTTVMAKKKTGLTTLEKLSFFTLSRKSCKPETGHRKHSFVRSATFSRILGNTYNTKKYEEQQKTKQVNYVKERFHQTDNPHQPVISLADFQETHSSHDLGTKAFRTISKGIGKLWWKRSHSVEISTPDPEYKVSYLGNVLTGWAKGKLNSLSSFFAVFSFSFSFLVFFFVLFVDCFSL